MYCLAAGEEEDSEDDEDFGFTARPLESKKQKKRRQYVERGATDKATTKGLTDLREAIQSALDSRASEGGGGVIEEHIK